MDCQRAGFGGIGKGEYFPENPGADRDPVLKRTLDIVEQAIKDLPGSRQHGLGDPGSKDGDHIPEILVSRYQAKRVLSRPYGEMPLQ